MTIIAGLDTETTGLLDPEHRIVEIYIGFWRDEKLIWSYDQRINPERGIGAMAQAVHGISASDLIGKPTWDTVGPVVHGILQRADSYVWHNGDEFDGKFLHQEFVRIGLAGLPPKPALDTMQSGTWATHNGKSPRLQELCFACSVPYDPALAHEAKYDVEKMMECLFIAQKWGFYEPAVEQVAQVAA
jgi:DNA polymerase-3 subunit epsilon